MSEVKEYGRDRLTDGTRQRLGVIGAVYKQGRRKYLFVCLH